MITAEQAAEIVLTELESAAIVLSPDELAVLEAYYLNTEMRQQSLAMCQWLGQVLAHCQRLELMKTSEFPPLPQLHDLELVTACQITEPWRVTATARLEKFFTLLGQCMLGMVCWRYLDILHPEVDPSCN